MKIQIEKIRELKKKVEDALKAGLRRPIKDRDDEFCDYLDGQLDAYSKVLLLFEMKFEEEKENL